MTENEAIKELKEDVSLYDNEISRLDTSIGTPDRNLIDALEMAIQALEKQIPKKPLCIANLGYTALWLCPVCERRIIRSDLKYCHQCGQKLNWSDEE